MKRSIITRILVAMLAILIAVAFAKKGVDYSTLVSTSKLECLIDEQRSFDPA